MECNSGMLVMRLDLLSGCGHGCLTPGLLQNWKPLDSGSQCLEVYGACADGQRVRYSEAGKVWGRVEGLQALQLGR